jgi:VWFA-related protein
MTREAAVVAAVLAFGLAQPQTPRFRAAVEAVTVDVLVTDRGRPVAGLSAADFELRDAGVIQSISAVEMSDVPVSLLMALDTSESVHGTLLQHLKEGAAAAMGALAPGDRAALITFNQAVIVRAEWGATQGVIVGSIERAAASGTTSLFDAAFAALVLRDPLPGSRSMIMLFSDGGDTASWLPARAALEQGRRTEAVVYGIAKTRWPNTAMYRQSGIQLWPEATGSMPESEDFLSALADATGGRTFVADRGSGLRDIFQRIVTDFRSRYVLSYTPQGVDRPGWHPLDVKLTSKRGSVRARRGYSR